VNAPTLLLLNPNTSADVSQRLLAAGRARAPSGLALRAATARFGARYIADEAAAAIAAHAALDALAADVAAHGRPSAVLLACFGDPGLFALRAVAGVPVLGLAEAAMHAAAAHGPFVVVTGGPAWVPMLARLVPAFDLPAPLLGVQAVAASGAELAADPPAAARLLAQAAGAARARWPQARSVLLGGAGLAGWADAVAAAAPGLGVPVLDSVALALDAAFAVASVAPPAAAAAAPPAATGPWQGLSPPLLDLLSSLPPPAAGPS
jgi:Asp/Glu/hydantoin racemase